jgi:RNA recognition motif-containing protein
MERKLKLPAVPNLKLGRKVVKEKYEEVSEVIKEKYEEVFNRAPKQDNFATMFCGNLPQGTTSHDMRELFQGYGEIQEIIMKVGPAKNKNYCFIR